MAMRNAVGVIDLTDDCSEGFIIDLLSDDDGSECNGNNDTDSLKENTANRTSVGSSHCNVTMRTKTPKATRSKQLLDYSDPLLSGNAISAVLAEDSDSPAHTDRLDALVQLTATIHVSYAKNGDHSLSFDKRVKYNRCLAQAQECEEDRNWCTASKHYINALNISDRDMQLHRKLFVLRHILKDL